jgi:hypothetical protein
MEGDIMFTKQALGAFLAGGVLVGGITFAGVAHGVGTGSTSTGQSDAQYTAKHAWVQSAPLSTAGTSTTSLSIPAGERVTITSAIYSFPNTYVGCSINATVNGANVSYSLIAATDGLIENGPQTPFQPIYTDSGSLSCGTAPQTGFFVTLVGYLTPIPAG